MNARSLALFVPAALLLIAGPVRGDDAKPATVVVRARWKADDVASLEYTERRAMAILKVVDGKPVDADSFVQKRLVELKSVSKCIAADANGYPTKIIHYFGEFKISDADKKAPDDTSLSKVHVEVNGVGAARTVTVLTPGAMVSVEAMGWLDEEKGKGDKSGGFEAALEPKEAVAVGASWKPSVSEIAKLFTSDGMTPDESKMSADATLQKIEGDRAEFEFVVGLALKNFPFDNAALPWKSGGSGKVTLHVLRALAADSQELAFDKTDEFEGIADGKTFEVHFAVNAKTRSVLTPGGTFPEVPKAK